jgi:DNA polymerase (family 10)
VDIRLVHPDEWGAALQYFTGSKEHNIHLRTIAKEKGLKISEYGVFRIKDNKRIAGEEEEDIYRAMDFRWMPPEMREDRGELELAAKHKLPRLITPDDIRGDLHLHTTWSDGMHTIEEVARYVKKNLPYRYIALTDHSKASRIANGMDEKQFRQQLKAIREVNEKLGEDFVKSGAEVDILPDGALDMSDEVLAQFDIVVASIHASFNRDNTERLIKACENPYVAVIGHPTGRLIGSRDAYPVDMRRLIEAARETGTALEINAQPNRMDLNDEWARLAREKSVKLVISTDMHQLSNFNYMKLGILVARRAWCTAYDVLNTGKWKDVQVFIEKKRKRLGRPSKGFHLADWLHG